MENSTSPLHGVLDLVGIVVDSHISLSEETRTALICLRYRSGEIVVGHIKMIEGIDPC